MSSVNPSSSRRASALVARPGGSRDARADRPAIEPSIEREILDRLTAVEAEFGVRVVYACESGSRAWGFESPDSDYDVRFVYARPCDWYLSFDVERQRDVIEQPIIDDIDCSGWDLRKAMYLFTRTNGALIEWLNSPIRYVEQGGFAGSMRALATAHFNAAALCYHYSHMARRNFREHLSGSRIRLKRYLYVLRPLLAIRHIERGLGVPPVVFESLVDATAPAAVRPAISSLLEAKRAASEADTSAPVPELNGFIATELARHRDAFSGLGRPSLLDSGDLRSRLNAVFRETIDEAGVPGR